MKIKKSNKKPEDQKRSVPVRIWLTQEEAESVSAMAQASCMPVAELFRRCTFGKEIATPRPLPEVNRAVYSELGRVSGNLQRLFSVLSSSKKLPDDITGQLVAAMKSIKQACQSTQQQILGGSHD